MGNEDGLLAAAILAVLVIGIFFAIVWTQSGKSELPCKVCFAEGATLNGYVLFKTIAVRTDTAEILIDSNHIQQCILFVGPINEAKGGCR